jgi:DNA segregation ATPase FtsK/SpoIIIE, S-DNA-T family
MAVNTYKANTVKKAPRQKKKGLSTGFFRDRRVHLSFGFFLIALAFFLLVSFLSYLFTGTADQSVIESVGSTGVKDSGLESRNWLGLLGAMAAHFFIFKGIGIAAFFIPILLFLPGHYLIFKRFPLPALRTLIFSSFFMIWLACLLGYLDLEIERPTVISFWAGSLGYQMASLLDALMGWGTYLLLALSLFVFLVFFYNIELTSLLKSAESASEWPPAGAMDEEEDLSIGASGPFRTAQPPAQEEWIVGRGLSGTAAPPLGPPEHEETSRPPAPPKSPELIIEEATPAEIAVDKLEVYDPTLDLSSYRFPTLELLKEYEPRDVQVTKEELEQNKDKIVETLINFKIGISTIKATIGPTVTLYEIVPDAGVKISRIKNLEDDIALSLSALGIRIIAPIPGKGTIGIEVPNKNREMVSVRSVLATEKFQNTRMELPVILGKTISNEVYIADLANMPHLLMAGATGQGKSVGINVLIASLLYKRHPSQLKFILVDPKKVELTLYNKIERHFLAMLPDAEEPIITDNKRVIHSLVSLCHEMDNRLLLLKNAGVRNLKEYNAKFVRRHLNPQEGHRYLPYIVLIIDELADLMVTSGKEIETPIARLAAVSRATGIHLVLATQRPSVNVITGIIKANFPARLSFRVTAKVDSRTILDAGGADQLVGMGDMLYSHGSEVVRLQGPFIDTSEVEEICDFIGAQRGYESAYFLPEYYDDEQETQGTVDLNDRDAMFDEAARLIVRHQQGSTSLIQRKLKLGYNRAGRLIDQLEAAGIVGSFEGSKAREVLIQDEYSLEQLLNQLNDKQH